MKRVESEFVFTHAHYGLKGTTKEQVVKNLAWKISDDLQTFPALVADAINHISTHKEIILGPGFAIFDWQSEQLDEPYVAIFQLDQPVLLSNAETYPTKYVTVLVSPSSQSMTHLRHLARISRLFHGSDMSEALLRAENADGLLAVLNNDHIHEINCFAA